MSEYTFRFTISQAAEGVVYTPAVDPNPVSPGNLAGWCSPSFKLTDSERLDELEADGGQWVGSVHMLPGDLVNMTATYFPMKDAVDNVQITGPLKIRPGESAIAITGGAGKFAGARGEARCVSSMSDQGTPLYKYELRFTV